MMAEKLSPGNLRRTLVDHGLAFDWRDASACEGPILLRHAVQVENIWIPYGEQRRPDDGAGISAPKRPQQSSQREATTC
jgi:hypothetical protein